MGWKFLLDKPTYDFSRLGTDSSTNSGNGTSYTRTEDASTGKGNWSVNFDNLTVDGATVSGTSVISGKSMCSTTTGTQNQSGNPVDSKGANCWCQATGYKPGNSSTVYAPAAPRWVFHDTNGSASACANDCASYCGYNVRRSSAFRSGVFRPTYDFSKIGTSTNGDSYTRTENTTTGKGNWSVNFTDLTVDGATVSGTSVISGISMCSTTTGTYANTGNPVDSNGANCWCQATGYKPGDSSTVYSPGVSRWVFRYTYSSASDCAGSCAYDCGRYVRNLSDFRSGVFGSTGN